MKRMSYFSIFRQRLVVAGLTLGLITVIIGVGIDIYIANNRSTLPNSVRRLTNPLNPQLDLETVETLEAYETVTVNDARVYVRQLLDQRQAEQLSELQDLSSTGLTGAEGEVLAPTQLEDTAAESEETASPFDSTGEGDTAASEQTEQTDSSEDAATDTDTSGSGEGTDQGTPQTPPEGAGI